jgi:GAF domain-containing protein
MNDRGDLAGAAQTIARQAEEIERLNHQIAEQCFTQELRDALGMAAMVGTIASPVSHSRLLEMIVETAADVIRANAASLFLIDERTNELVFEVALGQKAEAVKRFRVPVGHGIAGLVALSGQPIAVSDAQNDPRQASDISRSIGYTPNSILCVPLFYHDRIIGVLELLDKEGAESFSAHDMDSLGLFANLAGVAIEQSRSHQSLAALVCELLMSTGGLSDRRREGLQEATGAFAEGMQEHPGYRRALELAHLVQEIVHQGDGESTACRTILEGFAEYLRSRPHSTGETGVWR